MGHVRHSAARSARPKNGRMRGRREGPEYTSRRRVRFFELTARAARHFARLSLRPSFCPRRMHRRDTLQRAAADVIARYSAPRDIGGGPPVWTTDAPFIRHITRLPYDGAADRRRPGSSPVEASEGGSTRTLIRPRSYSDV